VHDDRSPVVVGIDGSDYSFHAAAWAAGVATKYGCALHLVHSEVTASRFIADAAVIAIRATAAVDQHDAAVTIVAAAAAAVAERFPDLPVTTEVTIDTAEVALTRHSEGAALVVIGCGDLTRTAALLLGSTALALIAHASGPVVAWRGNQVPGTAPIVVGVDTTPAGAAALSAAFRYADHLGAPVRAVRSCYNSLPTDPMVLPYLIDWDAVIKDQEQELDMTLRSWMTDYPGVKVEMIVEAVKPSRAILEHSADAQLVAIGNDYHSSFSTALLGTTTLNVLHHSSVPVMVCHGS